MHIVIDTALKSVPNGLTTSRPISAETRGGRTMHKIQTSNNKFLGRRRNIQISVLTGREVL